MKMPSAIVLMSIGASLHATTYYWIANDPGTQQWADATNLNNWSTSWVNGYPDPGVHPAALPSSTDELWLCRDMMLDLKGQSITVKAHQNGVKYKLGGTSEYWGAADHRFAVTNGTLEVTGEFRMRSRAGYAVYKDGVLSLPGYPKPGEFSANTCPLDVYEGGCLKMRGHVQAYNMSITVHALGSMEIGQVYPLNNTSYPSVIENYGAIEPVDGYAFRLPHNYGQNSASSLTLRQKAGVWKLKGNVDKQTSGDKKALCQYFFELSGGTLSCEQNAAFCDVTASMAPDADATVEVASGKTADFTGFAYDTNTVLRKTGAGALTLSGAFPSELAVTAGKVSVAGASTASFSRLRLPTGTALEIGQSIDVGTLDIADDATVTVAASSLSSGAVLLTTGDATALSAVAAAVNASLDAETGLEAKVRNGSVVLEVVSEEDRNTITVNEGSTTLSQWIATAGSPAKAIALVKRGGGTLVMDIDTTDYTGGITIKEGVVRIANVGQLCANGSVIVVEDGASLIVNPSAANSMDFGTREIHLCGAGIGGAGALIDEASNQQRYSYGLLSGVVVLEGDTTIAATGSEHKDFASGLRLDMKGHTLTVRRTHVEHKVRFYANEPFENPGHIVLDTCGVFFDGQRELSCFASGADTNTLTMAASGVAEFWNSPCTNGNWKMIWPSGGYPKAKSGTSNAYPGPVEFRSGTCHLQGTSGCALTFSGKVSGAGVLNFSQHGLTLGLVNPENDFLGRIQGLNGDTLRLAGSVAELDGANGTVALVPFVGLHEGEVLFDESETQSWRDRYDAGAIVISNRIAKALRYFTDGTASRNNMLMTYAGQMFVPGAETATWNVHLCMNHYAKLYIDGECRIDQRWWTDNKNVDIELTPGWHRFVLNSLATTAHGPSSANGGWVDGNGVSCYTKGFAIKFSAGAGANSDEYYVPADDGSGTVFRTVVGARIDKLKMPASGMVDLGGNTLTVGELSGCGILYGGNLVVTGNLVVAASDVGVNRLSVGGTATFGPGSGVVASGGRIRLHGGSEAILTAEDGISGEIPEFVAPDGRMRLALTPDGRSLVASGSGVSIIIR